MGDTNAHTTPMSTEKHLSKARQIGMWVFFVGATMQMLVTVLIFASFVYYRYRTLQRMDYENYRPRESNDQPAADIFEFSSADLWLIQISKTLPFLIVGALAFMLFNGWTGRQAGRRIGIGQGRYSWVGMTTVLIPSILAAIALMIAYFIVDDYGRHQLFRNFYEDGIVPTLLYAVYLFVPAIPMGMLAGFITRQRFRGWKQAETIKDENLIPH